MSDEQQRQVAVLVTQPLVVQGGDHGLAGASGGHDEVAAAPVPTAFDLECLEDLLLVGPGAQLETGEVDVGAAARGMVHGDLEPLAVPLGLVRLELVAFPVRVERRGELLQQRRVAMAREAHVPLQPVEHRGSRQVRRAHIAGGEPAVAVKQPGLGVQPRGLGVIADLDFGAELGELVERAAFGGAHIGGGDDPKAAAALTSSVSGSASTRNPGQVMKAHSRSA